MVINYINNLCVKAQVGDVTVSFNPPLRNDGATPRFSSNIALFSTKEKEHNFGVVGSNGDSFIINEPGEYEVGGIFVRGIGIEQNVGGKKKFNTVYSVLFDDINLCHLGAINISDIKSDVVAGLGGVDILFVPITGEEVSDPMIASKLVTMLEPKIVVPLYSNSEGSKKELLKTFLKEEGGEGTETTDKLTIRKKDIEGKEGDVVVLSTSA